ncbi:glycosyltransferase family 2 protein [Nodosilinea sp. LEGE 06152]|uniref:glycosyltransferase n=1 Tax=Nodosilinea sp. LEGE 06152 TaxID=2777966 RepID=UPI00187E6A8E|nr:glycosyltransferase family 2 protein [Nodosilinea sp. LEGE 06152]MBE9158244.1 glycosyltransferase family 2 protein [Nodosilinea sp. LEGE 06152]
MQSADYPLVSVIIPVFNDEAGLYRCLEALSQQTYQAVCLEIIVVDNGSDSLEGVKRLADSYKNVKLVQEQTPGSYAARNRGIALAQGDILAFTDADCIPDLAWIERGLTYFRQPHNYDMVVGRVEIFPQDSHNPSLVELYQMVSLFPQERYLKIFKGGATANVLVRRSVIKDVGPFNQSLKSFGDLEWGGRVFQAGYAQIYAEDVRVRHPARPTWDALRRRTMRTAGGMYDHFIRPEDSWLQQTKMLGRLIAQDLIPPVNFTISNFKNPTLKTLKQRLGVSVLLMGLRYVSALEKVRLRLGGTSRRA